MGLFGDRKPCESRGGRPGLPVPNSPTVSVDVKQKKKKKRQKMEEKEEEEKKKLFVSHKSNHFCVSSVG